MKTISNEEAFALGVRAVKAGIRPAIGMRIISLDCGQLWDVGVIIRIVHEGRVDVSEGVYPLFSVEEAVPDFRDPGTKGHVVGQLREQTADPGLVFERAEFSDDHGEQRVNWYAQSWDGPSGLRLSHFESEEEILVAAFEAIKKAS